jgi:hypothetical protein
MKNFLTWLGERKFEAHLGIFLAMILCSAGLYFAAQSGALGWIWTLLGIFALVNLLVILVR